MPLKLSPTQAAFNARGDGKFNRPFSEQAEFLRRKLNLPTERWDDIMKSAHDRAFVVAGATKADLLNDLHQAVDKAVEEGKSLGWFRQEFDEIVKKHGWTGWTGSDSQEGRDWRTRVIYQTNMSASYAAGRWQQLRDPDLLRARPYWKYRHNDTVRYPRILHQSWDGLVLHHTHPWWQDHFPPNGWGCRCYVTAVRKSEYTGAEPEDDGVTRHTDRAGNVEIIPAGIDRGWNYAPGASVPTTPAIQPTVQPGGAVPTPAAIDRGSDRTPHTPRIKPVIDDKLVKLPAPIGADMAQTLEPVLSLETQLQWTNTLDAWLNTPQRGRTAIVGAIAPMVLNWLSEQKRITPKTAEIAIREGLIRGAKQARHERAGDGLIETEWRELPRILKEPDLILFDNTTGKLIYIMSTADSGTKLAVEFDYRIGKERTNMIVSGYRQSTKQTEERIKRGDWTRIK